MNKMRLLRKRNHKKEANNVVEFTREVLQQT